jgi:phospholipase/lecithinase/hemolysin
MAYSGVHVFGDSLVDAGNALKLAHWYGDLTFSDLPDGAPVARLGYFEGRFTNGYTYADLLANKLIGVPTRPVFPFGYEDPWLGIPVNPFASEPSGNNLNWAYGGAQLVRDSEAVPDFEGQTDAFRDAVDGRADSNALYLITLGGNDVRRLAVSDEAPASLSEATAKLQEAAAEFRQEVGQLIDIGVRHLVVTGIPDVGLIPRYDLNGDGQLTGEELVRSQAATQYSALLDGMQRQHVAELQAQYPGVTITYVSLTEATQENFALLGQLLGRTIDPLADQDLLFFDQIHPTAQSHALLAGSIIDTLNGVADNNRLPLTAPDYAASGAIAAKGEVDKVVVAIAAGATYSFDLLGISTGKGSLADPGIRLLSPGGSVVAANDDGGLGLDSSLTFTAATAGEYVLELFGVGSMTGSYQLLAQGNAVSATTYTVTNASTMVLEGVAGNGEDVVRASVSYALNAGAEVERLATTNDRGKGSINLTGNEFAQALVGNAGANRLDGKDGADLLTGGAGKDVFAFSTALGPIDTITDYHVRDDTIWLDDAIFGGVAGPLAPGAFAKGAAATQADDRIIFDSGTGKLYFDPDGSGAAAQIHFATLQGTNLNVSAADFVIG